MSTDDKKCAPGKKFKDGSCFTLKSLQKIANQYNKKYDNKINITDNKEDLVKQLEKKITKCDTQSCWLRQNFIQELENDEINNNTLRPKGPTKKYEWLSTTNINQVVNQYQKANSKFIFMGAVPYDWDDLPILGLRNLDFADLEKNGKEKIGIVFNLDKHNQPGSHWVALYTDLKAKQVYFFDSFAVPPGKRIKKFITKVVKYIYKRDNNKTLKVNSILNHLKKNKQKYHSSNLKNIDLRYNTIQHQFGNSECGVYSINFIIRLAQGESFDNITTNITKDDEMNECRKEYFRNVS